MYDFLIVGAGLYGATFARLATDAGKSCLVIDRRNHIAGNAYTKDVNGICVHEYGAHIFHTDDPVVWRFVNRFAVFNRFTNMPVARYDDHVYNLPFNMNTFSKIFGVVLPSEAERAIKNEIAASGIVEPKNLEEQAISMVGKTIYKKLVKGYTEKQWGKPCKDLPPDIIKRLPLRFTYDNNYFNDLYQGIPFQGYTEMVRKMLKGIDVKLGYDFLGSGAAFADVADKIIYTGAIDEFFNYRLGTLEYRSLRFDERYLSDVDNLQGVAVMNYVDEEVPFTRVIEHKHFNGSTAKGTVITTEYPAEWHIGDEPYYPIRDEKNTALYKSYENLAKKYPHVHFGGRLGTYQYMDMDDVILSAIKDVCWLVPGSYDTVKIS